MLIGREKEQEMLHNSLWHAALRFAAIRGDRWGFSSSFLFILSKTVVLFLFILSFLWCLFLFILSKSCIQPLTELVLAGAADDLVNKGGLAEMMLGWELL